MEDLYYSIENKSFLGEHKVITPKQRFLGIILCFLWISNGRGYYVSLQKRAVDAIFLPHLMIF